MACYRVVGLHLCGPPEYTCEITLRVGSRKRTVNKWHKAMIATNGKAKYAFVEVHAIGRFRGSCKLGLTEIPKGTWTEIIAKLTTEQGQVEEVRVKLYVKDRRTDLKSMSPFHPVMETLEDYKRPGFDDCDPTFLLEDADLNQALKNLLEITDAVWDGVKNDCRGTQVDLICSGPNADADAQRCGFDSARQHDVYHHVRGFMPFQT